jgi:APA family basic amino acid/polyamine antiporter
LSFRRALGPFDATMVVIGGIIGGGIFINPHVVAQRLSSPGLVLAAWIVGGAIALAGAFAFAELATLFPRTGGEYVYLKEAYHPGVAFLFGWASLLMIQGGGLAAVAITFAQYAIRLTGGNSSAAVPLAVGSIVIVAGINYAGVKPGSLLLNLLVIAKIAALAVLIAGGLWLGHRHATPPPSSVAAPGGSGLLAFGAALIPILFTYGGWQNANIISEEMRDSRRTLPKALLAGTAIVIVIYMLANVVYLSALTREGLAATTTPAADAVRVIFGPGADRLIAAAITVSAFGFLDLTLLAPTRIYYAMARDGLLDSVVFGDWIFFGLTGAAIFVFRRRVPIGSRESGAFRTPGYPLVPALFVAAAALAVVSAIVSNPKRSAIGTGLLATGVPVYFFYAKRRNALRTEA